MSSPILGYLDPDFLALMDDMAVRKRLLKEYRIEIVGGFGQLKGKAWRIGLMGYSAQEANVHYLLAALAEILG